jgi:cold shock protein
VSRMISRPDVNDPGTLSGGALDGAGLPVRCQVKWFNAEKGFGFVTPDDGTPDAFLHVSVLMRIGMDGIADGADVVCVLGPGAKGPQVLRILDVLSQGRPAARQPAGRAVPTGPEVQVDGTVKWFKPDKGFGFVVADDSGKDVFVHKSVLRRCGLENLITGQRVSLRLTDAPKGREAVWLTLLT